MKIHIIDRMAVLTEKPVDGVGDVRSLAAALIVVLIVCYMVFA